MNEQLIQDKQNSKLNKYPKGITTAVILASISLLFSAVSLFLILILINKDYYYDSMIKLSLLFSVLIFSLLGLICAIISFIKARIIHKSGRYTTTATVLSIFGIIITLVEMFIIVIILLSNSF